MLRIVVNGAAPDSESIRRAAVLLRDGGIGAIPTDTLYGLAVNPFDAAAVNRLFTIKHRATDKALLLVAADTAQVCAAIGTLSPVAEHLAAVFWPGPLTLVMAAPATLGSDVTGGTGTVGVRVPAHDVTRALCAAAGTPLTATSANMSGRPATADPNVVARDMGACLDLLVDAGLSPGGLPSTIVDVTGAEPRLIREGALAWDAVLSAATRR